MSSFDTAVRLVYLMVAGALVLGLHMMNSPATAKRGDRLSAMGMTAAVVTTLAVIVHDGSIDAAGPAMPVEVQGLNGVPLAGDDFTVAADEGHARDIAAFGNFASHLDIRQINFPVNLRRHSFQPRLPHQRIVL